MKIGVLGTGMVGETLATKLALLKHDVMMGSRNANNEKMLAWAKKTGAKSGTFADAAAHGETIFVATSGAGTLDAVRLAKKENLAGKLVVDVTNPLDFSKGMPPFLSIANTDSLAERIQAEAPDAKVVKTLNTIYCGLMVNPRLIPEAQTIFVSGNDAGAKESTRKILESFGWKRDEILDLGDITTARGTEGYLLLWLRLWSATGNGVINVRLVQGKQAS